MSGAIAELERKVDVTQKVKDHPWTAVGVAFSAGIALSASRTDVRAAKVTADATRETGTKLSVALDGVVAALIAGVAEAFNSRIEDAVKEVVASIRGTTKPRSIDTTDGTVEVPIRAD
jgi:predicted ATP-grasp superfamily ATP-dependent carboligase